jgi:hypothetical protein
MKKNPMVYRKGRGASNIKTRPKNMMRGVGPTHGGPGFARSLPTHVRIKPGPPTTFAGT